MPVPKLKIRPGNPDFLDLPWDLPILEWNDPHLVEMPTGIHRHPVVFVAYPEGVYAIKELPLRLAKHEFRTLRKLAKRTTRSARPAGLVVRGWADPHEEYSGALITRFVNYAFPYRELVSGGGFGSRRRQLLDAFAGLLVELHLAGCFWGDCSLSNVLYRYDAAKIEAVMVDAETSRLYDELSVGQRREDLEIMQVNLAGDMSDIAASQGYDLEEADLEIGFDITDRYVALWDELTTDLVIASDERYRIRERVGRLNDLGFAVDDVEIIPDGSSSRRAYRGECRGPDVPLPTPPGTHRHRRSREPGAPDLERHALPPRKTRRKLRPRLEDSENRVGDELAHQPLRAFHGTYRGASPGRRSDPGVLRLPQLPFRDCVRTADGTSTARSRSRNGSKQGCPGSIR